MNVLELYDKGTDRTIGLAILHAAGPDSPHVPWIVRRHPDGQWITEREATDDDIGSFRQTLGWPTGDSVQQTMEYRGS